MKILLSSLLTFAIVHYANGGPLRLQKRAAFYIANETACVVDNTVYTNGDPIPTDDPCEACKCRPPGFACVLKDCEVKPGCRAVRRAGVCCPEYICGCEHNGRMFRDGDEIRDSQNPCYTCHCQGSSIACAFVDCFFRVDCAPEYIPGECCPHYNNCNDTINIPFDAGNPYLRDKEISIETTTVIPSSVTVSDAEYGKDISPDTDTTLVDIVETETMKPELLQLNPEIKNTFTVKVEDTFNTVRDDEKQHTIRPTTNNNEFETITDTSSEVESSPQSPIEESSLDTEAKYKQDIEVTSKANFDHDAASVDDSSSSTFYIETTQTPYEVTEIELVRSTETQPEEIHSPLVSENVNVEPEEPSNTLELEGPDYGKSLRFPDHDTSLNVTETVEDKESKSEQLQAAVLLETSSDRPTPTSSTKVPSTEVSLEYVKQSNNANNSEALDKNLRSNEKKPFQIETVETVTIAINVRERTQPPINDKTESLTTSTEVENFFKSLNDKLEDEEKLLTPEESLLSSINSKDEQVTPIDVVDKADFSIFNNGTTTRVLEQNRDSDESASTTESQIDITTKSTEDALILSTI